MAGQTKMAVIDCHNHVGLERAAKSPRKSAAAIFWTNHNHSDQYGLQADVSSATQSREFYTSSEDFSEDEFDFYILKVSLLDIFYFHMYSNFIFVWAPISAESNNSARRLFPVPRFKTFLFNSFGINLS